MELEQLKSKYEDMYEKTRDEIESDYYGTLQRFRKELTNSKEKEEKRLQKQYKLKLDEDFIYLSHQGEDTQQKKQQYIREFKDKNHSRLTLEKEKCIIEY